MHAVQGFLVNDSARESATGFRLVWSLASGLTSSEWEAVSGECEEPTHTGGEAKQGVATV